MVSVRTASGQSLPEQINTDTLCFNIRTAKRLAYYKLNYFRLDTVNRQQKQLVSLLEKSLKSKGKLLDICYMQNFELEKKITNLEAKLELKDKQCQNKPIGFFVKVKYISIGVGIAGVIYLATKPP